MKVTPWVRSHPLVVFYLLAYVIAWGGSLLVAGPTRLHGNSISTTQLAILLVIMLIAPGLASVLTTALMSDRQELREMGQNMRRLRVPGRWYAIAMLTTPLLLLAILLMLSALVSPVFLPNFNLGFFVIVFLAAFIEEFGWSSFATPRLLHSKGVFTGGLVLGLLWGFWHLTAGFMGSLPGQELFFLTDFLIFWILALTAYRIIMTWVYSKTRSVPVAQIMHASFSGTLALMLPTLSQGQKHLVDILLSVFLWAIVLLITLFILRPLSDGQPKPQVRSQL